MGSNTPDRDAAAVPSAFGAFPGTELAVFGLGNVWLFASRPVPSWDCGGGAVIAAGSAVRER